MADETEHKRTAPRNRTITVSDIEKAQYLARLLQVHSSVTLPTVLNRTIHQNVFTVLDHLPAQFADLIIADPPYNLTKNFNGQTFTSGSNEEYMVWLDTWLGKLPRLLKPTGTIYICGDWRSCSAIYQVAQKYFLVRNRITWEREKGRGAVANWKNASEDIWFCTMSEQYTFNSESVKLKRRVLAPYTTAEDEPKDWEETDEGRFRLTFPSNLWTDVTVPFWSMAENTNHPTQKPEKLIAKLVLASSNVGNLIFDPFLGSGTTAVVAKKLKRNFVGVELDQYYCCLAEKRLELANVDQSIQGYIDDCFWERNTLADQKRIENRKKTMPGTQPSLF
ncbi:MAG TPA: site-specific DNA-methyltransferase [Caldilineaceae bacterium]|nr:site-specific DNA-methyltransferase [Caldilineaceae bacterium]